MRRRPLAGTLDRVQADLRQARSQPHEHAQDVADIGRLAGSIAHDFNNQLAIIVNYGALLSGKLEAERRTSGEPRWDAPIEALGEINDAAARAGELTRRLAALSARSAPAA
jgi:two-component system, cell cycle sensor histidine kinase and response regulator CckA